MARRRVRVGAPGGRDRWDVVALVLLLLLAPVVYAVVAKTP